MRSRTCLLPAFLPFICSLCPLFPSKAPSPREGEGRPESCRRSKILCTSALSTVAVLLNTIEPAKRPCTGTGILLLASRNTIADINCEKGIAHGKKGVSATIQPCIRTLCIRARSRRPSAARPRFAGPRAALRAPPVPVVPERVIVLVLPLHINRRYSTGTTKGVS